MTRAMGFNLGTGVLAGLTMLAVGCGSSSDSVSMTGMGGATGQAGMGGSAGGGVDAGTPATLYAKYGGAPTVAALVDQAVAGVTTDCRIAPFFDVIGTPGHRTGDQLKSCLRLQFTALLGGPATYPGTSDMGVACQDMRTIHAGLGISSDAFDIFVMDLVGVLKVNGVSDADIATIGGALAPTKADMVAATPRQVPACPADGGAQ